VDTLGSIENALDEAQSMGTEHFIFGDINNHGAVSPKPTQEEQNMPTEKKSPVTLDKLEAEAPDLLQDIRQKAADGVDLEPARKEGAAAERENVLALAKVHFGETETGKFEALVNSGMTVDMYQAAKDAIGQPEPKAKTSDKMDQMLEGIQNAGAENPGAGSIVSGPASFDEAWQAIKSEKGCSTEDAMKQAVRKHPDLHSAMIGGNA